MHYFATQLNNNQQTSTSLRARQYRTTRKRRRLDHHHGSSSPSSSASSSSSSSPEPETHTTTTSRPHSHASLAPSQVAQLRVAGLSSQNESDTPSSPFPHAPPTPTKERHGPGQIQREIAEPPTRLYPVHGSSGDKQTKVTSLRKTHLNVLSTVMHRCLLDEDYKRAGRAWGMLLRTQVAGGHPVDPRNHARWGIGAEILLHRKPTATSSNDQEPPSSHQAFGPHAFTEEGFELAKEYYERLIIQHPNRRLTPNAVDERTFYPAMFSLWIFEICEKSRHARWQLRSRSTSYDSVLGENQDDRHSREDAIQVEELASAKEIAERLDQLIASPPFDKQASLLQLRGHVGLWISVLLAGRGADDEDWDMEPANRTNRYASMPAAEHLARLTNCSRELQQARQFFEKAEANGASRQTAILTSIDIKLKQLTKQSAKLRAPHED